ncbi:hypothetical protein Cantr_07018 [Candida viswanathii]|uniref:Uncharacterized protein n=1 Tax=Candida viswanathii TaxID=5486 RepID=A0A367XV95_9ASCO|nr:hypothetical protein Cantr_07018 [Candida viswanathii]
MNVLANSSSSEDDSIVSCTDFDLDYSDIIPQESASSSIAQNRISLPPDYSTSNRITNELFQVTSNLRKRQPKRLNNDKIERLIQDLNVNSSLEESGFELDDTVRTRVFKGRFKNRNSPYAMLPSLSGYFDENKENRDKPSRVTKSRIGASSSAPILQPITNNLKRIATTKEQRSPKRLCLPKHTSLHPQKPSIKASGNSNIFLIESLTGLINDATKYGTELNGSRHEDYPLPEHENEVVQIPTNEDDNPKMAIIRMYKPKKFGEGDQNQQKKSGFYTEAEFDIYKDQQGSGVQVVSLSVGTSSSKKKVRWASNLEW